MSLLSFAENCKKPLYILGYCRRGWNICSLLKSKGIVVSGFCEAKDTTSSEDVIPLRELADVSIIVAVRYSILNDIIPTVLHTRINDIYFPTLQDLDDIEEYDELFEGNNIEDIYPQRWNAYQSALKILGMINEFYRINSAIDFGCGSGAWLGALRRINSDSRILGLDSSVVDRSEFIPNDSVEQVDFVEYSYNQAKKWDLAISIEVAEHIDSEFVEPFIDNLCAASDMVLFSAAIEYQRGNHHVNCQYPSYWKKKFEARNYYLIDFIRPRIWEDNEIILHCRQNCLLFINKNRTDLINIFSEVNNNNLIDVVHPEFVRMLMNSI